MHNKKTVMKVGIDAHKDLYSPSTFNLQLGMFKAECIYVVKSKSVVAYLKSLRQEMGITVAI